MMKKFSFILLAIMVAFTPMAMSYVLPDDYTISDFESDLSGTPNVIVSTEVDTYSELNAIVADVNLVSTAMVDTYSELNAIVADVNLVSTNMIDTFAELDAIVADKSLLNTADAKTITALWTVSGNWNMDGATYFIPPMVAVASLPAAGTVGRVALVNDAASATDCSTGSGTLINLCGDNGANWTDL